MLVSSAKVRIIRQKKSKKGKKQLTKLALLLFCTFSLLRYIHNHIFFIISANYRFTVVYGDAFYDGTIFNDKNANSWKERHFSHFLGACQKVSPEIAMTQEVAEMILLFVLKSMALSTR